MTQYLDDNLVHRAMIANERWHHDRGFVHDQPAGDSGLVMVDGQQYVELHNSGGTLALYLVLDGVTPRITWVPEADWPAEFRPE